MTVLSPPRLPPVRPRKVVKEEASDAEAPGEAGEEAPVIKTGAAGAQVLVMQFGKTTARLGSGLASRAFPPPKEYKLPAGTKVA